jgi:hypothetical protein
MIAMEMSGKDGNIRGICPELHFFGFFQTMLSPVLSKEIHPNREESHRIEPGLHFPSVASSGTNRGWGERAMQISCHSSEKGGTDIVSVTATSKLSKKARNSVISDFVPIKFLSLQIGQLPNLELKFQSAC